MGGFQYIDLSNYQFTSETGVVVDGIYNRMKGTDKPIVVHGLTLGGVLYRDEVVQIVTDSGQLKGFIGVTVTFTVSTNDVVIFYS